MSPRNRSLALLTLSAAAVAIACGSDGGTDPASGPLKIGIISGNNQTASAPTPQLAAPIVGRLVRLPNGTVAWQTRALDALLPAKAYAQTVQGSPVAGAVVCAAPVDGPNKLTPVVPCTNTASDGTATFAFTHGTTAGVAKAIVQGMLNGQVATFDTATATVSPGAMVAFGWSFSRDTSVTVGQVIDFSTFGLHARDVYGNLVTYAFSYRRVNADSTLTDPTRVASNLVTVRAGDSKVRIWADDFEGSPIGLKIVP